MAKKDGPSHLTFGGIWRSRQSDFAGRIRPPPDGWLEDYAELFGQLDDTLTEQAKAQLQCEVIFLTHNDRLHEVNMGWHPKGEDLLWRPDQQETKFSQTGGKNVRYKRCLKGSLVEQFTELLRQELPYCTIRYPF